jgi:peptidoglycan/LPS O-acetylase OafA/YrhL
MTSANLPDRGLGADRASIPHLPALDGLRGLAVAAVFLFHSEYAWARGGFLGVSAFFTLSGFLITTLLLVERDSTGRIDLRHFWSRRARRLLPAAFLALGGIILYGAFVADPLQVKDLHGDVMSALGYFANWHFVFEHQSYAEIFNGTPSPVLHFWSLAIEEQFYLVFPLLAAFLLWVGRGRVRVFAAGLVVLTFGSLLATMLLSGASTQAVTRVYYGTDTRAAELLIGALTAVFLIGRRRPTAGRTRVVLQVLGGVAFVALVFLWAHTTRSDTWLYHGGLALHASLVALVVATSLLPGPLATALSVPPLRYLGRISYGVYLYHWPVFLWLSPERLGSLSDGQIFLLRTAVTLTLAITSFYVLERPVRLGLDIHRWWPRLAAPVAIAAIVVAALAVRPPAQSPDERITFAPISKHPPLLAASASEATAPLASRRPTASAPPASKTNAPATDASTSSSVPLLHRPITTQRPIRVLVVGDSVGQTFGRGMELWGIHTGRAQVWNDAHFYCALGRYAPRAFGVGVDHQSALCDSWGERWPEILQKFDPDVVVMLYTFWEITYREPPGTHELLAPGAKQYDDWQYGEYLKAVDTASARGAKVVWLTIPCRQGDTPDITKIIHHLDDYQLARVAKARPGTVRLVNLHDELCPNDQFQMSYGKVATARPDGAHFSDAGAEAVANWLMQQVLAH